MRRLILAGALAVALGLACGATAFAAPIGFQLVFDGHHIVAGFPTPTGLAHVGTFTTNYSSCSAGSAADIAQTDQVATRLFSCDGGGATFTATVVPHLAEHGGTGSWQIISGTGPLADLRGKGSFSSVLVSGDPNNFITIAFRSTWAGIVDLDATPPTLSLARDTATKLKRRIVTYKVGVGLTLGDNGGGAVTYALTLLDPATLNVFARRNGTTSASSIAWTFIAAVGTRARSLRLQVDVSDAVGNQTTLKQSIRLKP
jgi:hypothetical protein